MNEFGTYPTGKEVYLDRDNSEPYKPNGCNGTRDHLLDQTAV